MTVQDDELTAKAVINRLVAEAEKVGDARRLGTLTRLIEACDDLLSGGAYRRAKAARRNPEYFNPNFLRLTSTRVEQYVRLRAHLEGGRTSWTGPVASTIRAEKDLMAYLKLREQEVKRPGNPRSRGPRSRKLNEIVDGLQSITDQAVLRQALADGRKWKRELDILLETLRRLPDLDVEALREGKVLSSGSAAASSSALAPEDSKTLRKLLVRITDSDGLSEFGLVYRNGRVKMDFAPGTDLVMPEEIALLARLAEVEPPKQS